MKLPIVSMLIIATTLNTQIPSAFSAPSQSDTPEMYLLENLIAATGDSMTIKKDRLVFQEKLKNLINDYLSNPDYDQTRSLDNLRAAAKILGVDTVQFDEVLNTAESKKNEVIQKTSGPLNQSQVESAYREMANTMVKAFENIHLRSGALFDSKKTCQILTGVIATSMLVVFAAVFTTFIGSDYYDDEGTSAPLDTQKKQSFERNVKLVGEIGLATFLLAVIPASSECQ